MAITRGDGRLPGTIFDLPTPALLLDRAKLERNAERMREKVRSLGVTLRPHVKTSKIHRRPAHLGRRRRGADHRLDAGGGALFFRPRRH